MKEDLLRKFLNGTCNSEEIEVIKKWIQGNNDETVEALFEARWESLKDDDHLDQTHYDLLKAIHARLGKNEKTDSFPTHSITDSGNSEKGHQYIFLKIAASVLLCACSVWFAVNYFTKDASTGESIASSERIIKKTAAGQKLKIVLPDSSVVILNSSSSIEYPSVFSNAVRSVKLSGEAFFEVAHERSRPFIVSAGSMETTVLGTKFNISSKGSLIKVALAEGKVRLTLKNTGDSATLSPGQMGSSGKNKIDVQKVDIEKLIAWKHGIVVLKSASLEEVFKNLETWYDVKFTIDKSINTRKTVSGKFNNENLHDILSGLSFSLNFQFQMSDDEVIIRKE